MTKLLQFFFAGICALSLTHCPLAAAPAVKNLPTNAQRSQAAASSQRQALLNSLNPYSISEQLAFYELYPNTPEGRSALNRVWKLFGTNEAVQNTLSSHLIPQDFITSVIQLVNSHSSTQEINLSEQQLEMIEKLGSHLANRSLKGHTVATEEEVLTLADNEIDLSRGLLLSQFEEGPKKMNALRQYEAILDLMALQILGYLQPAGGIKAPLEEKIDQINRFVFEELHFRFPPHSSYAPEVDMYTFLSSVIDTRRGVCLGVSFLYMALAQRLNVPIEIITPPGHIYLRCNTGKYVRNIETTARGIHLPSDTYLGINTRSLQKRTAKETIGMGHFNQASVYSQQADYSKAISCYRKAEKYLKDDPLLTEILAYHLIFAGDESTGRRMLQSIAHLIPEESVIASTMIADYLNNKVDAEGLKAVFMHVDETQDSLLNKQKVLKDIVNKYPTFREGLTQLATTWLQLNRDREALSILKNYHKFNQDDPTVEYYLAVLMAERADYQQAWKHLRQSEKITAQRGHHPQALKELQHALRQLSPE